MAGFGPIHTLIVREVGEPYGPLDTDDFDDFEIVHPDECKLEDGRHRCAVGFNAENCAVRFSLKYAGTPVEEPGEYKIRAWSETYRGFDYTEHDDGGICLEPA